MKKLNKKLLGIGLIVLFFSVSLVFLVKAQEDKPYFFRVNSASTTPTGAKRAGDEALIHIANRSGKSYFVPNKTLSEFESFRNNAPNYVAVSVCGDGVCGEGENIGNCRKDCKGPDSLNNIGYCGDTICGERVVCTTTPETITVSAAEKFKICDRSTFWGWLYSEVVVPAVEDAYYFLGLPEKINLCASSQYTTSVLKCENVGSESWETCPDDCVPTSSSGCGVCGYDGAGNLCPNFCNESSRGALNLVNCNISNSDNFSFNSLSSGSYTVGAHYTCDSTNVTPCPAGKYCIYDFSSRQELDCPSGYFCPENSFFPRQCPPSTYSSGGASTCTACPLGTYSMSKNNSSNNCQSVYVHGDLACQYSGNDATSENPINSPKDCPDDLSKTILTDQKVLRQGAWYGDGRCTGVEVGEASSVYYSPDCRCGNDICDPEETTQSCYIDCSCGNGICDSVNNPMRSIAAIGVNETGSSCSTDCSCGDGICDSGETYSSCSSDCKCGNGSCEIAYGENYSTCSSDCKCGNGVCESIYGENSGNCSSDCHCGNFVCQSLYGEKRSTCSVDCTCGDGFCDNDEYSGGAYLCAADCHCGLDADNNGNFCDAASPYNETSTNCPKDCGGFFEPDYPLLN